MGALVARRRRQRRCGEGGGQPWETGGGQCTYANAGASAGSACRHGCGKRGQTHPSTRSWASCSRRNSPSRGQRGGSGAAASRPAIEHQGRVCGTSRNLPLEILCGPQGEEVQWQRAIQYGVRDAAGPRKVRAPSGSGRRGSAPIGARPAAYSSHTTSRARSKNIAATAKRIPAKRCRLTESPLSRRNSN